VSFTDKRNFTGFIDKIALGRGQQFQDVTGLIKAEYVAADRVMEFGGGSSLMKYKGLVRSRRGLDLSC